MQILINLFELLNATAEAGKLPGLHVDPAILTRIKKDPKNVEK